MMIIPSSGMRCDHIICWIIQALLSMNLPGITKEDRKEGKRRKEEKEQKVNLVLIPAAVVGASFII